MRYLKVKFRRKSLKATNESSMEMVVPQMRPWLLDPPRASASEVTGLMLANDAASEPSWTTRPASSRITRRGICRGVRRVSELISPRRDLTVPDRWLLTNRALLSLRSSDCWPRSWRPGLELAS